MYKELKDSSQMARGYKVLLNILNRDLKVNVRI